MVKNSQTHQVGDLINLRYEIVGMLGSGGMSSVYMVKDQNLDGQLIALKLLDPVLLRDATNIERFKREAIIARRLDHPNIVRVYDFDVTESGEYYLTMEYVEGSTLSDRLKNTANPLSINQLTKVLYEIASALENAHKHGVVHRDLKPANVLLTKEGKVKIADFGLCRASGFDSVLSTSGECLGTPAYMSPEQIRGESVDGRSDIYSLGMLAFEACEGAPPFRADTWFKVAEMHLRSPLPKLSPTFPDWYRQMVQRCSAKAPEERYDSARQLLELLEEHLAQSVSRPKKSTSYGHYMAGALGASCVLALCAMVGIAGAKYITRDKPLPDKPARHATSNSTMPHEISPQQNRPSERRPFFNQQEQNPRGQQDEMLPLARLKQLREMQGPNGEQEAQGQNEFRGERQPMQQRDSRNQREDSNSKVARFICTRAGRTIETDSIPEGKNWECRQSGQMNQMPQESNSGNEPRVVRRDNNRPLLPQKRMLRR